MRNTPALDIYGARDITTAFNFLFQTLVIARYNVIYSKTSLLKLPRCVKQHVSRFGRWF